MDKEKILVVDDEEEITKVVKAYLEREDYQVYTAYTGKEAVKVYHEEKIDFIILDLMLPDLSGEEVCQKIRMNSDVPILMLTAKGAEEERIKGLDIGADDYVVKPFSPKELIARVRAILRRGDGHTLKANIVEINQGDLHIDFNKVEVIKKGKQINLTNTEFELLTLMAKNPKKVFSREELVIKVLGYDYEGYDRTIDAHMKNLRHKIDDKDYKYIKTIYGKGYRFEGNKDDE